MTFLFCDLIQISINLVIYGRIHNNKIRSGDGLKPNMQLAIIWINGDPGASLNIKMSSYQYRVSHYKE